MKNSKPGCVSRIQKTDRPDAPPPDDALFGRVASILEQARTNVVRAVNHNMVVAYWLIGREIVMELQRGQERAGYGDLLIAGLSRRLTGKYGPGYSVSMLKYFKQFYLTYQDMTCEKGHTVCGQFDSPGFSAQLSWSHYRLLIRVGDRAARVYYEREAVAANWSVRQLERQIQTHAWNRLVSTRVKSVSKTVTEASHEPAPDETSPQALVAAHAESTAPATSLTTPNPLDSLKDPYVLEFLDIPDPAALHETGLEAAIIAHLRDFLLEIGKGFAFVARQKRLSFDDEHLYVDLVFYSIPLRCYLLIDLKTGKLTPGDVGQMDSYVRMFDDLMCGPEDNPTIGLILCTEHNSAVARYSVLNDRRQIFASRYVTCLPTEAELAAEIQRTRALIEGRGGQ